MRNYSYSSLVGKEMMHGSLAYYHWANQLNYVKDRVSCPLQGYLLSTAWCRQSLGQSGRESTHTSGVPMA